MSHRPPATSSSATTTSSSTAQSLKVSPLIRASFWEPGVNGHYRERFDKTLADIEKNLSKEFRQLVSPYIADQGSLFPYAFSDHVLNGETRFTTKTGEVRTFKHNSNSGIVEDLLTMIANDNKRPYDDVTLQESIEAWAIKIEAVIRGFCIGKQMGGRAQGSKNKNTEVNKPTQANKKPKIVCAQDESDEEDIEGDSADVTEAYSEDNSEKYSDEEDPEEEKEATTTKSVASKRVKGKTTRARRGRQ